MREIEVEVLGVYDASVVGNQRIADELRDEHRRPGYYVLLRYKDRYFHSWLHPQGNCITGRTLTLTVSDTCDIESRAVVNRTKCNNLMEQLIADVTNHSLVCEIAPYTVAKYSDLPRWPVIARVALQPVTWKRRRRVE